MPRGLNNALVQSVIVLLVSLAVLLFIRPPIPISLLGFYMAVIVVGQTVFVTTTQGRMESFWAPIHTLLISERLRVVRWAVLTAIPLAVGGLTAWGLLPSNETPATFRVIHPAPPGAISFQGKTIDLRLAENPLREAKTGDPEAFAGHVEEGRRVYYQNCFQCHGDHLTGEGPFAGVFNPRPANFQDVGTIAQLQESYLFWRIAKGGPGLPGESAPGRSAMPRWEGILTEKEIWAVILFLYEKTGHPPRTWE
ncbi:MAG: cytochrome c [bacterium]